MRRTDMVDLIDTYVAEFFYTDDFCAGDLLQLIENKGMLPPIPEDSYEEPIGHLSEVHDYAKWEKE